MHMIRIRSKTFWMVALALGAAMFTPSPADAGFSEFTFSSGSLAAKVRFEDSGESGVGAGNLRVTLTNTSAADVLAPPGVLTAVFFDIATNPNLTPVSALLGAGSTVLFDSQPAGGNVGGEFAYAQTTNAGGLGGTPAGFAVTQKQGISSSGFGIFGNSNFNGSDLDPPTAIDGLNYGLTSAGDNSATGNSAVTGNVPLIHNSVVFLLSGFSGNASSAISNIRFQYGTALDEGNGGGNNGGGGEVPAPASLLLALTGVVGLGLTRFRRWRRRQPLAA